MKSATIAALDRINRRFYDRSGHEFSATRQAPWPAWDRVVDRFLATRCRQHATHSILDIGCGNGRFAGVLESRPGLEWSYWGVDCSLPLAAIAHSGGLGSRRILAADVVNRALPLATHARYDLIVAFGLMHHIPSWERRRSLLVDLAKHLADGGMLAVSFWQFGEEPRFAKRFVDWDDSSHLADEPLRRDDLESGDHLLRWGDGEAVRYCHFADPVEAAELTAASGLCRLETFRGDGASGTLNLYHLLRNQ